MVVYADKDAGDAMRTIQRKRAELFELEMAHARNVDEMNAIARSHPAATLPQHNTLAEELPSRALTPLELQSAEASARERVQNAVNIWLDLPTASNADRMQDATADYPSHWARGRKRVL